MMNLIKLFLIFLGNYITCGAKSIPAKFDFGAISIIIIIWLTPNGIFI